MISIIETIDLISCDSQFIFREPIQNGILFNKSSSQKSETNANLTEHLKATLSTTLDTFYPFATRLAQTLNPNNTSSFFNRYYSSSNWVQPLPWINKLGHLIGLMYYTHQYTHCLNYAHPINSMATLDKWAWNTRLMYYTCQFSHCYIYPGTSLDNSLS